jgi:hypothetical protein
MHHPRLLHPDANSSSDDTGSVAALKERLTFLGEAFSAAKKKKNKKQNLNSRPTVYEPQIRMYDLSCNMVMH